MNESHENTIPQADDEPTVDSGAADAAQTDAVPDAAQTDTVPDAGARRWHRGLLRGRTALAAGVTAAALALGGAGFGVGYAVGHEGADDSTTPQFPAFDRDGDGRGVPPDGRTGGFGGPMGGSMDGQTDPGNGDTGQAPDFDGDGQPDDSTSPSDSSDSAEDSSQPS